MFAEDAMEAGYMFVLSIFKNVSAVDETVSNQMREMWTNVAESRKGGGFWKDYRQSKPHYQTHRSRCF